MFNFFFYFSFSHFLRQSFINLGLTLNSLCGQRWPWTPGSLASTSWVLGLKLCTTMLFYVVLRMNQSQAILYSRQALYQLHSIPRQKHAQFLKLQTFNMMSVMRSAFKYANEVIRWCAVKKMTSKGSHQWSLGGKLCVVPQDKHIPWGWEQQEQTQVQKLALCCWFPGWRSRVFSGRAKEAWLRRNVWWLRLELDFDFATTASEMKSIPSRPLWGKDKHSPIKGCCWPRCS